ncbi:MAG: hypothetical protein JRN68_01110 [Nitrososphaerota archaeon]|nr:hypothetical protein [Nitrososphaerota archaeon]
MINMQSLMANIRRRPWQSGIHNNGHPGEDDVNLVYALDPQDSRTHLGDGAGPKTARF